MILSESEKNRIAEMHMLNENFIGKLLNRFKNSNIYTAVESAFDKNPNTFVKNIISKIPKLKKVEDELLKRINDTTKLSDEEKEKHLKDNEGELMNNIKSAESQISEQTAIGTGGAAAAGIGFGPIFMVVLVIVLIYILVGLKKENKLKKTDPEKYAELKGEQTDRDKEFYEKLKPLVGKKVNLYTDERQSELDSNSKILGFNLSDKSFLSGDVPYIRINIPIFSKGITSEAATYKIYCKFNPLGLDNKITEETTVAGPGSRNKTGVIYSGETVKRNLYNKQFTDKVSELASKWCRKPEADFGSIDKGDVSNLA